MRPASGKDRSKVPLRSIFIAAALLAALLLAGCASAPHASVVKVTVTEDGFEPASVHVPRGQAATLEITRRTEATCATEAVFAETGAKVALPLNETVRIPIPTERSGTLHFACGMDMYRGEVEVD
jgi:plastocyanin domain-containing protein